ncbi:MAG: hypothetical protein ACK6DS_04940 [Planctomycetota bacterium]|jgi:hypothetical protein
MSWDASIVHGTLNPDTPLGKLDDVVRSIENAIPGLTLQVPPVPTKEMLDMMPPFIKEQALNPGLEADYDDGELSIRFSARNDPVLYWINLEVRGTGNPLPLLDSICRPMGWAIMDSYDRTVVDLTLTEASAWTRFCEWRNRAFGEGTATADYETQ